MNIIGLDFVNTQLQQQHFSAKMICNESGAIFFPTTSEHRNQKAPGLSYEDNYKGNALAAMLAPNTIEIRYHKAFSDQRVTNIITTLTIQPGLTKLATWTITYQGRKLR